MPSGQSHTTWFPGLKTTLKDKWKFNLKVEEHFDFIKILNSQLSKIRKELKCVVQIALMLQFDFTITYG